MVVLVSMFVGWNSIICCWKFKLIYFLPVVVVHVLLDGGLARPEHVHELGPLQEDGTLDEVPGERFDSLKGFKESLEWYHWFGII